MRLSNYSGLVKLAVSENLRAPTIFTEGTDQMNPTPPEATPGQMQGGQLVDASQAYPNEGIPEGGGLLDVPLQDEEQAVLPEEQQDGRAPYGQESIDVAIADAIRTLAEASASGSDNSGNMLRDIVFSTRGMQPPPPPPPPEPMPEMGPPMSAEEMDAMSQQAPGSVFGAQPNLGAANPDLPAEGAGPEGEGKPKGEKSESKEKKPEKKEEKKSEKKSDGGKEVKVSIK